MSNGGCCNGGGGNGDGKTAPAATETAGGGRTAQKVRLESWLGLRQGVMGLGPKYSYV